MWKGWIACEESEKEFLESLGIQVGEYDDEQEFFRNCIVSDEALNKLDPYWGDFIWCLDVQYNWYLIQNYYRKNGGIGFDESEKGSNYHSNNRRSTLIRNSSSSTI